MTLGMRFLLFLGKGVHGLQTSMSEIAIKAAESSYINVR